jgi:transposase
LRVEGGLRPEEAAKLSKEVTLVSTELTAKLPSDFNGPKKVTAYVVREYVKAELLRGIPAAKVAKESKKKFLKQGVGYHTVGEWCRQWKREGLKFPTVYNQRPGFKTPEEIRKYAEGCFKDGTSLQQILKWIEAKFGEDKVVHITTIYGWRNAWKRKQEKLAVKPEAEQTQDKQQVSPSPVKSEKVKYGSEVFVFVKGRLLQYESPEKIQEALAQRFPAFKDNPPLDVILEWRERLRRAGQIKRPA